MNRRNNNKNQERLIVTNNNNQRQRVPISVRNALRSMRRQDNKQSILVAGSNDPRPIIRDVVVTKLVETSLTTATTDAVFTYATIYKLLDTNFTPFFTDIRIISTSVYGPATDTSVAQATVTSDGASFLDRGVAGSRRPCLHIRFPEIVRITWAATTSTASVLTIPFATLAPGTVVQFTIEVRADAVSGDS
jgi:hypothetical protein